ncbi:MAG: hypothetical protein ABI612_10710 [Betaproteobacteria bacterium]
MNFVGFGIALMIASSATPLALPLGICGATLVVVGFMRASLPPKRLAR